MVRKFEDREKELILNKLLDHGKRLFSVHGLKKTSVADLTKAAGISQGAFYLFYPSKEELYFDILEQEEELIRTQMIEMYFTSETITRASFKQFLRHSFAIIEENPLIQQLHNEDLMELLFRKLPPEKIEQHFAEDSDFLAPIIIRAQAQGQIKARNPEDIVSLIRTIVLLALQKQRIGEERYPGTIDLLIELVANGLVVEKEESHHD